MPTQAHLRKTATGWCLDPLDANAASAQWVDGEEVVVSKRVDEVALERLATEAPRAVDEAHRVVTGALGDHAGSAGSSPAEPSERVDADAAKAQLDLVLSFFSRVETKLSVVLAIDLGMLSVAFAKALPVNEVHVGSAIALAAFVICQAWALLALYRGSFPELNGGHASLVYFREVAKLREADYTQRFAALPKNELARDHLEQAWRNARILTTKFNQLQRAYQWTALSIVPWMIALALLAAGVTR